MTLETTARNAACNAVVDLLNSGDVQFQTSGGNEVATCTFGATAFGDATAGVATANAITADPHAAGGTIGKAVLRTSAGATLATLTVTAVGGGGDIEITSLAIGVGDSVSISSLTVTQPAS
ncbi:MAG TPA: hypothetical protein PLE60_13480 [Candidatus Latescibacteria bacterium]|nr:hypothetical protein [Candidatus Latescibacterota bacterium]